MRLHVRLTPKAREDRIDGWTADAAGRPVLMARVRAAPVEGAANAALERLLAEALGVPPSQVRVSRGASGRLKAVDVPDLDAAALARALGAPL